MPRYTTIMALGAVALFSLVTSPSDARDWSRFRGPHGSGQIQDAAPPVEWGDEKNLAWKVDLPGPGSSCPIVVGDRVYVTCWTGYGLDREEPGDQADLMRCLCCYDRRTGEQLWRTDVAPKLPEDEYSGMFAEHGYASHTPVSDGERVYVYFGKTGALAFDLDGKELWRTDCGDGSGINGWGSASSPVLHGDLMICAATAESHALIALNKATGEEVWRHTEEGWDGVWGTPLLVEAGGRTELVFSVPFKLLALDPTTGEVLWHSKGLDNDSVSASAIEHNGIVYALGGRGGSVAVRTGGSGDVTDTHTLWRKELRGSIASPIYHDGRLHWIGRGGVDCADAATGERIYQKRFVAGDAPAGEGRGRRRRGAHGSYSSPVVAGDLMYHFARSGDAYVVRLGAEFEQVAKNTLTDGGDFSATPAVSDGEMFVRSSKYLYCLREGGAALAAR